MAGLNKVQIIGYLGNDPEMRFTSQGQAVTSFNVGVSRRWNDRDGSSREETTWFRVTAWERLAEICNQYLAKGKQVYIEGRIRPPQAFINRDGQPQATLEIVATDVLLLGSRADSTAGYPDDEVEGNTSPPRSDRPRAEPLSPDALGRNQPRRIVEDSEDDLPF